MIPRPLAVTCLALVMTVVMTGCRAPVTDVGKPCVLVKRDPDDNDTKDGIRSISVKEHELTDGKDFISFGSTECDDYVCVRDRNMPKSSGDAGLVDAAGYCSKPCSIASPTSCAVAKGVQDPDSMRCRPLLLDESTIAALCNTDPEKCRQYFGPNRSPYFCARGEQAPDGGSSGQ